MTIAINSWRIKLGLVLLLVACVSMGGWLRSRACFDMFAIHLHNGDLHRFVSCGGRLSYRLMSNEDSENVRSWLGLIPKSTLRNTSYLDGTENLEWDYRNSTFEWRFARWGFDCGRSNSNQVDMTFFVFPYWSIAMPMTLAAAGILLGGARRSKREQSAARP